MYFTHDGHATRLLVYREGDLFSTDGAQGATRIVSAVDEATKEGTLTRNTLSVAAFGTATTQLRGYVDDDLRLLVLMSLTLVFLIVLIMLRSVVAAAVVVATVVVSYLSALGISTFVWQDLLGRQLHWAVPSMAAIALIAVGAD